MDGVAYSGKLQRHLRINQLLLAASDYFCPLQMLATRKRKNNYVSDLNYSLSVGKL